MALETVTYISDLIQTNPVKATDDVAEGADHLQNIKKGLLNTLPNLTGAMNASHTELNNLVGVTGKTGTGNVVLSASPTITGTAAIAALTLTTDLAVAHGGTGASDAATARTNLGVAIGSDVQAYNAGLADIAALAKTNGNFIVGDGANWVAENGATARTSLGLGSIATQAANSVAITGGSISGITDLAVADGGTGASTASAARTNLGLGSISTQAANSVSITGGSITGITDLAIADGGTGASSIVDAQRNLQIFTGHVNSTGTTITGGPSGWTVSKIATGRYRITHNLGLSPTTDLRVIGLNAVQVSNSRGMWVEVYATNHFDVICQTFGGTGTDDEFFFCAIQI